MKRSNQLCGVAMTLAVALAPAVPSAARADTVTEWNAVMQATVTAAGGAPASNPNHQTRWGAIVQLAVFEAVNAIVGDYEPYLGTVEAPAWASPEAAVVAAAHRTLVTLRPDQAAALDACGPVAGGDPGGPAKDAGIAVGEEAAAAMLLAPGGRRLGRRRALHAGDQPRRLAADCPGIRPAVAPAGAW